MVGFEPACGREFPSREYRRPKESVKPPRGIKRAIAALINPSLLDFLRAAADRQCR